MSIHEVIRQRRTELGLSHSGLAARVNELERPAKPISRQTVQHWEKAGGTAPKRSRLEFVAVALGTTIEALMSGEPARERGPDLTGTEERLLVAFRALHPASQATLLQSAERAAAHEASARETTAHILGADLGNEEAA